MPDIDVVDSTWIGAGPRAVGAIVSAAARWRRWWPDLDLAVEEWRGPKGMRWLVRSAAHGRFAGTMEVWLEPVDEGVVAHYFLRLDPVGEPVTVHARERLVDGYRKRAKQVMWAIADEVDPDRLARVSAPSVGSHADA